jgi:hypothetical protein
MQNNKKLIIEQQTLTDIIASNEKECVGGYFLLSL